MAERIGFELEITGIDQQIESLNKIELELKQVTIARNKLLKTELTGTKLTDAETRSLTKNTKRQASLRLEKQKTTTTTKNLIKAQNTQKGSLQQLESELNLNIQRYKGLSSAQRKNKAVGGAFLKTINKQDAKVKKLNATLGRFQGNVGNYSGSIKGLETQLAKLISRQKKLNLTTDKGRREFQRIKTQISKTRSTLSTYNNTVNKSKKSTNKLGKSLIGMGAQFLGVTAVILGFFRAIKNALGIVIKFNKQLIAVGKTTNLSGINLKKFGVEIIALGIKLKGISTINLLKTAEVAGQLGIRGSKNILKFSETIEKLGLTSDIIGQDSARSFAKFISLSSDTVENADRLGSVITQLGNNFATTEGEILSNTTEIQKGIAIYNTSAQGVIGLGAATSALGSKAEVSRGAMQKVFKVLNDGATTGTNLNKILELTGQTQKEFVDEFGTNSIETFRKFVKGLSDSSDKGINLSNTLTGLNLNQLRVAAVVGSLAKNYNILEGALNQANKEYVDNTALNKEAEAATESIASIIGDLSDAWNNLILQQSKANGVVDKLKRGIRFLTDNLTQLLNITFKVVKTFVIYKAILISVNLLTKLYTITTTALRIAQIALAGGITKAVRAMKLFNTVTKSNPIGALISVLALAVASFVAFRQGANEAATAQRNLNDAQKENDRIAKQDLINQLALLESKKFGSNLNTAIAAETDRLKNESIKIIKKEIAVLEKENAVIRQAAIDKTIAIENIRLAEIKRKKDIATFSEFKKQSLIQEEIDLKNGLDKQLAIIDEKFRVKLAKVEANSVEEKILLAQRTQEKEDAELASDVLFADKKRELQNEIDLNNAETQEEKDILKAEQDLEKQELALENLQLTLDEKHQLEILLETQHQDVLDSIHEDANTKQLQALKKANDAIIASEEESAKAREDIANVLEGALIGFLGDSLGARLAAVAIEGGISAGLVAIEGAKATAAISSNTGIAVAKSIAASPLTFGLPWSAVAESSGVASIAASNIATKAAIGKILAASALKGLGSLASSAFKKKKASKGIVLEGNTHDRGGIDIGSGIEAEHHEMVLTRGVYENPYLRFQASKINQAAGGRSLDGYHRYASGGVVDRVPFQGRNIEDVIEKTVRSIINIPVTVLESDITGMQNRVKVNENQLDL